MNLSPLINQLSEALRCLPGVGPKTSQRMVMHLLERDRDGGLRLAESLAAAMQDVGNCSSCRNLTEKSICDICSTASRDSSLLCVVESPADVLAVEQAGGYRGLYFVLMGHLSPIDGIGPEDLGFSQLMDRLKSGEVQEIILATNPTVEGEATAHYISELVRPLKVIVSKIAHGVPFGGELEFVDGSTLAHALQGRTKVERTNEELANSEPTKEDPAN